MLLFASRPIGTRFSESPVGWYLYCWDIAIHPEYVEWRNTEIRVFMLVHSVLALAMLCGMGWMAWRWYVAKKTMANDIVQKTRERKAEDEELQRYKKPVDAQRKTI